MALSAGGLAVLCENYSMNYALSLCGLSRVLP
jgi:hypothetical protein